MERGHVAAIFLDSDLRDTDWSGRVLDGTTFERCRMFGMHGELVVRPVRSDAPDYLGFLIPSTLSAAESK